MEILPAEEIRKPITMTIQQAAADAIAVQSASNLSGVAHSFLTAVQAVNEEASRLNEGTEWRNNHPIIRLFVDKRASLCRMQGEASADHFGPAYRECQALVRGEATG